jgi:hypothetical protein
MLERHDPGREARGPAIGGLSNLTKAGRDTQTPAGRSFCGERV